MKELTNEISCQSSLLTKLRQSILQEAIEGKLTVDWRRANPVQKGDPDYDADTLLAKIIVEKQTLIRNRELKKGKLPKFIRSFIGDLTLPIEWVKVKADDIYFVTKLAGFEYSKHVTLSAIGEIPVIRAQNVRKLHIYKRNLLYIDRKTSLLLDRCALTQQCLLVTFIGAGIGDIALFDEKERYHLAPNVAKMEPFKGCDQMVNNRLFNYFLLSKFGQKEIFKHMKATAQPSLSMETIRDIDFPLPPLAEQRVIVERIEKLLSMVDELETRVKERKDQTAMLLQSVLREVFEAKLEQESA
ncbi:MAG: restriction endonuclease subunit S [Desulfamplus sp.]|nr:restriction endonuclease subunit S [Desulfamplus sp.]